MSESPVPSLFPIVQLGILEIRDGSMVAASQFCQRSIGRNPECARHYQTMSRAPEGFVQCPFGFTTRGFNSNGRQLAVSGVVAHPRFGSEAERKRAKDHPELRVSRNAIDQMIAFIQGADALRDGAIKDGAKVLPQAFHELRKLNGAIIQHAEKELKMHASAGLETIKSAAELMRNNFDILEALSNIDGMKILPLDSSINVFDLCYKTKKVLDERARARGMQINLTGRRAIVHGSQKSFPLVPAVLIENAIKYGRSGTTIAVDVEAGGGQAVLTVENETDHGIDPVRCFERGTRYASSVAEGGGFGLFLAREVVSAHRGSIRCDPRSGVTKLVVTLPLERVVAQAW